MSFESSINPNTNPSVYDNNVTSSMDTNERNGIFPTLFIVPQRFDYSSNNQAYLVNYPMNRNLPNNDRMVYANSLNMAMIPSNNAITQNYTPSNISNSQTNVVGQLNDFYNMDSSANGFNSENALSLIPQNSQPNMTQAGNSLFIPIQNGNNSGLYFVPMENTVGNTLCPQVCRPQALDTPEYNSQQNVVSHNYAISDSPECDVNDAGEITVGEAIRKKKGGRKETHNQIEKRYRMQINMCFVDLENVLFPPSGNDASRTHTKSVILRAASDTIRSLRTEKDELIRDNISLKQQIRDMAMNTCSSCQFKYAGPSINTFLSRGCNSSWSYIIAVIIALVVFISTFDKIRDGMVNLSSWNFNVPHILPFAFIVAWIFVNWKESATSSPDVQAVFLTSRNRYYDAISRYDSQTAIYHIARSLEVCGVLVQSSRINTLFDYLFSLPFVLLHIFVPQIAKIFSAIFKPPTIEKGVVSCSEVCECLCLYLGAISTGRDSESAKNLFWIVIKSLHFYFSKQDEIPREFQLQILLNSSYIFGMKFPLLSRILLNNALKNCSENIEQNSSHWIFDQKLRDRWLNKEINSCDIRNELKFVLDPSEYYDFRVRFAIHSIENEFLDFVYYIWDVRNTLSTCNKRGDSIIIELHEKQERTLSLLSYFGGFLKAGCRDYNSDVVTILSNFIILYSPWVTKLSPFRNVELSMYKPDRIYEMGGIIGLINEAAKLLNDARGGFDIWSQTSISDFSQKLYSLSTMEHVPELYRVVFCICSEISLELRDEASKSFSNHEFLSDIDPVDGSSKDSTVLIRFGSKFSQLDKRIYFFKQKHNYRCMYNPIEEYLINS